MIYTDGVHLITDNDVGELHEFAKKIGLKRCWFQAKSRPHYDLTTKRKTGIAISAGAKLITPKELVLILMKKEDIMTVFKVIYSDTSEEFNRKVNRYLKTGWKCQGGVSITKWDGQDFSSIYFAQAMVKIKTER